MATYTGTSANDLLTGTAAADTFLPLLGHDTVSGGGGLDTLSVDYSSLATGGGTSTISTGVDGLFAGTLAGTPTDTTSVGFIGIANLSATLSSSGDTITLDARPLTSGATLSLNGGAGFDTLVADFSAIPSLTFQMGENFLITSNAGAYAGFEQYALTLGGGTSNVITQAGNDTINALNGGTNHINTGDGKDVIWSTGSVDTIDGGAGLDTWYGDYTGATANIAFGYDGFRGEAAMTNGSYLSHIEAGSLATGSGDDAFFFNGPRAWVVDGGAGSDTFTEDDTGISGYPYQAWFMAQGTGSFQGQIQNTQFYGIEHINVAMSEDDNWAYADTSPLAGGATLNLDGGGGFDTLVADNRAYANSTFVLDANGEVRSDHGLFGHFEQFGVALGGGTNTVTLGAGDDTIWSNGGTDTIDGGSGWDLWIADYSANTANLTFVFNGTTGGGALTGGTTVAGIEGGLLTTGSGADTFQLSGANAIDIDGGAGTDSLVLANAALTGLAIHNYIYSAGGWFSGFLNGGHFDGIEKLNATFSADDNDLFVDASPLAAGTGATLTLNGGAGTDTLAVDFSAFASTNFIVNNNGTITGNHGSFSNWERFSVALGSGTNNVVTGMLDDVVQAERGGTNSIQTGDGNDSIYGGTGNETVLGGSGVDTFYVHGKAAGFTMTADGAGGYILKDVDLTDGNQGTDRLTNVEFIQFDDSSLALPSYGTGVTHSGTMAADSLVGTPFDDFLYGLAGDDTLSGSDGDDFFEGGDGNDRIIGGSGHDTVSYASASAAVKVSLAVVNKAQATGGAGSDTLVDFMENLTGSAFADTLTGNALDNVLKGLGGNDRLDGGAGTDTLIGGAGNDTYVVDHPGDTIMENGGEGTDVVSACLSWTLGANLENLTLTGTAPINGTGNELNNALTGNAAENFLSGLAGKDTISGGAGDDTLSGGLGADVLTGGAGADHFRFDLAETTLNKDTIKDFTHAIDVLEFSRAAFGGFGNDPAGYLDPARLALGTAATTTAQHLIYDQATGNLWYDADGSGAAAKVLVALLSTKPVLDAHDIMLI